ncbi:resuscitation-promoting factor [Allonocardiopsis opalescens]|uniref:Uncharacterized protein YabE (DUF348 family) n=1 Tax=Allonocardiopsis opalescens TaxID=1144618 RepID=A0A2T0QCY3_9ACTN|nr:resuscitation-promoting factor [Allonocardiopsis opalescens]PRY01814.1 uncharacterized protein YabE (DUF348 family) [Allonocardiopsis opalescens]
MTAAAGRLRPPRLPALPLPGFLRSRTVQIIAAAVAAVAVVLGGFAVVNQRVTLVVNGESRSVFTLAGTVQEVLADNGVPVAEGDLVAPAPATALAGGARIEVLHARPLTLTLDGETQTHTVAALTVGEALERLELADAAAELSVDPATPLPPDGLEVDMRSAQRLAILLDQTRIVAATTAPTVRDLLAEYEIPVGEHDFVEPGLDEAPETGMVVRVWQLLEEPVTEEEEIPAEIEERENAELEQGTENVVREPEPGLREITYGYVMEEGERTRRVISEEVVREPVNGITEIGTMEPEEPEIDPNVGGDADSLNWAGLAECESGGNPTAVNPAGYYGLYQFSTSTWASVGGSGLPSEASPDEQTMRAKMLYNAVGGNWQSQWPHCGVHLFD